jgi:biopolymer transport protein ExbD
MPEAGKDHRLFLRADRAVPYGELMEVLEILRSGGFLKVALVALEGLPDSAKPAADDPSSALSPVPAAPPQ